MDIGYFDIFSLLHSTFLTYHFWFHFVRLPRHGEHDEGVVGLVLHELVESRLSLWVHEPSVIQRHVQDVEDPEVGSVLEAGDVVELDVDVEPILQGWEDVEGVVTHLLKVSLIVAAAGANLNDGSG